jgi:tetratricopeptide (TPR) repeat protein
MRATPAAVIATIFISSAVSAAPVQPPLRPAGDYLQDMSWLERLQWWTSAITQHQIGTLDEPAERVAQWSIAEVQNIGVDIKLLVSLMRNPSLDPNEFRLAQRNQHGGARPVRWRFISREQSEVLRRLAHDEARKGDANRLLKRGAMLHTDVAMQGAAPEQPATAGADPRPRRLKMYFADGRRLSIVDTTPHWNIARALLDDVSPAPGRDSFTRLWYQATTAHQQSEEELDPGHVGRAVDLFPDDPDILFFAGCLHETYASPAAYRAFGRISLPPGMHLDVGSVAAELRQSERFFSEAVRLRPAFTEARVRLARVTGLLGKHRDAAPELRRATLETDDPLLLYYAHLFLGAEEAALGQLDAAREAYQRAADLYPLAQSPHLALSELAYRANERGAATAFVERVLALPAGPDERPDPWWTYHVAQGRTADDRLAALRQTAPSE